MNNFKIEHMRRFYEMFPYPNRPSILSPSLRHHKSVHGGFSKLICENKTQKAQNLMTISKDFKTDLKILDANFPKNKKICLVGCGTDEPLLFQMLHPQNEILCLDLSKNNIKIARRKIFIHKILNFFKFKPLLKSKLEFMVGDASIILKQKFIGQFDYIQCFGVLHHQPDPEHLLSGISERLYEGGALRIMVYSYHGRNLERKIQKNYAQTWNNLSKEKNFKFRLYFKLLKLKLWQALNYFGIKKSTSLRFKYLGLNTRMIADALMHPSDPGLPLGKIIPMALKFNLKLVYCQAKLENEGMVYGFENTMESWEKIVTADKENKLINNPILIFKKTNYETEPIL